MRSRLLEWAISVWIISLVLPCDLAIRSGPKAALLVARPVHDVSAERLMREHPGQTYIHLDGSAVIPAHWALVIVVATNRRLGMPLISNPQAPLLFGQRDDSDGDLPFRP